MANAPTLVVLPGLDGTDVFSRPFLTVLQEHIQSRVVCYPASGRNRYEDLLAHARDAVSDLREFYLLGASFGGPLALMLAASESARVRGVILSATFVTPPSLRLARLRRAIVPPLVFALRLGRRIPIWLKPPDDPLRSAKAKTWSRTGARALAARARAALEVDARDVLQQLRAPLLSLTFTEDRVVAPECGEEILRLSPRARRIELPGGHLGMFSDPGAVAGAVARFIEDVEALRKVA